MYNVVMVCKYDNVVIENKDIVVDDVSDVRKVYEEIVEEKGVDMSNVKCVVVEDSLVYECEEVLYIVRLNC